MIPDPIVEEVRAIRDDIAKHHGYDIRAIFEMLRRMEAESGREHVTLPARREDGRSLPAHDPQRGL